MDNKHIQESTPGAAAEEEDQATSTQIHQLSQDTQEDERSTEAPEQPDVAASDVIHTDVVETDTADANSATMDIGQELDKTESSQTESTHIQQENNTLQPAGSFCGSISL